MAFLFGKLVGHVSICCRLPPPPQAPFVCKLQLLVEQSTFHELHAIRVLHTNIGLPLLIDSCKSVGEGLVAKSRK